MKYSMPYLYYERRFYFLAQQNLDGVYKQTSHDNAKRNRVLFDFESIVDLKLSRIRKYLIEDCGKAIIDEGQMDQFKFNRMYVYQDPLSLFPSIDKTEDMSNPEYPVFTGMRTLADQYKNHSNSLIDPVVLCRDQFQQRIIKNSIQNIKVLVAPRNKIKTFNFARIVLANPKDALDFKDPITVDFMVLNFRENFSECDPTLLPMEVLIQVGDVNRFSIAKAYPTIPDPVG